MNSKLSIIVPVYNVEQFLDYCLDSIYQQRFTEWECILVDDGSTDSSGKICDVWAQKDNRFQVFHKKNGGLSSARNFGLRHSTGTYVMFIDSDDSLMGENLVSQLVEEMESDSSLAFTQYILKAFQDETGELKFVRCNESAEYMTTQDVMDAFALQKIAPYACNKIYRRVSIPDDIRFPEGVYYEDERFMLDYLPTINHCKSVEIGYYIYRLRQGSITQQTFTLRHAMDLFKKDFHGVETLCGRPSMRNAYLTYFASSYREYINVHCIARRHLLQNYRKQMRILSPRWIELYTSSYSVSEKIGIAIIKFHGIYLLETFAILTNILRHR